MNVGGVPGGALDKNAFLQLLVAQMQYQDPLAPQDSTAFVAQLAQFSALEQLMNLVQEVQSELQVASAGYATELIGKTVEAQGPDGNLLRGVVQAIRWVNGEPVLEIGGQTVDLASVKGILGTIEANSQEG